MKIKSVIDAQVQYTGRVSGKLYQWSRAGDVIEVLDEDAPELLAKRRGKRLCCGNGNEGNKVFEIYQQ